jgi:hypothetical protein
LANFDDLMMVAGRSRLLKYNEEEPPPSPRQYGRTANFEAGGVGAVAVVGLTVDPQTMPMARRRSAAAVGARAPPA